MDPALRSELARLGVEGVAERSRAAEREAVGLARASILLQRAGLEGGPTPGKVEKAWTSLGDVLALLDEVNLPELEEAKEGVLSQREERERELLEVEREVYRAIALEQATGGVVVEKVLQGYRRVGGRSLPKLARYWLALLGEGIGAESRRRRVVDIAAAAARQGGEDPDEVTRVAELWLFEAEQLLVQQEVGQWCLGVYGILPRYSTGTAKVVEAYVLTRAGGQALCYLPRRVAQWLSTRGTHTLRRECGDLSESVLEVVAALWSEELDATMNDLSSLVTAARALCA